MADIEFAEGLIFKLPRAGAPEYVKGSLSIKRTEFIAWLQAREGDWVNLELKESKGGKAYAQVDTWKPGESKSGERSERKPAPSASQYATSGEAKAALAAHQEQFPDDDIPF